VLERLRRETLALDPRRPVAAAAHRREPAVHLRATTHSAE
jgi:hypothetical protein